MLITIAGAGLLPDRAAAGFAVGLRRGVVGPRAGIGDAGAGVTRPGDHDDARPVRRVPEGAPEVLAGDGPRVRGQIDERVDHRPAGALLHERADEAVRVDPVGGAEIDDAEHRLVREAPRRGEDGRMRRLERRALRERVPRVVVRHAREFGAIGHQAPRGTTCSSTSGSTARRPVNGRSCARSITTTTVTAVAKMVMATAAVDAVRAVDERHREQRQRRQRDQARPRDVGDPGQADDDALTPGVEGLSTDSTVSRWATDSPLAPRARSAARGPARPRAASRSRSGWRAGPPSPATRRRPHARCGRGSARASAPGRPRGGDRSGARRSAARSPRRRPRPPPGRPRPRRRPP